MMKTKTVELTRKEIKGILDIIDGTIDTLNDFADSDTEASKEIEFWSGVADKLYAAMKTRTKPKS